jgi:hypothetical protein
MTRANQSRAPSVTRYTMLNQYHVVLEVDPKLLRSKPARYVTSQTGPSSGSGTGTSNQGDRNQTI